LVFGILLNKLAAVRAGCDLGPSMQTEVTLTPT
jgi:hypothetical protein